MGPGQSIKLRRFVAGEPLLDQLSAERLNTILSAIESKGVIFGRNVTGNWTTSGTIVRSNPPGAGGGSDPFPFKVKPSPADFGVKVYPGTIARMVPTIYGTALDTGDWPADSPVFSGIGGDFELLLKVNVDLTHGVNFRGGVIAPVTVVDSVSESDYGETGELAMTWDDEEDRTTGHFYIRIASIKVADSGVMSLDTQWLFESYDSFVINDPDVIILE